MLQSLIDVSRGLGARLAAFVLRLKTLDARRVLATASPYRSAISGKVGRRKGGIGRKAASCNSRRRGRMAAASGAKMPQAKAGQPCLRCARRELSDPRRKAPLLTTFTIV